jgi:signal transduction histidine kinase
LLALQAGLAVENLLLLERERERVAVEGELRAARSRLDEQQSVLGQMVKGQEEERVRVARKLHDDLGQILAAVLWGLQLLPVDTQNPTLPELRGQVVSVLDDLRDLAGSLRPPTLDQLGLVSGLEFLAERARERDGVDMSITAGPLPADLPAEVQTGIYRIVEDTIAQLGRDAGSTLAELSTEDGVVRLAMILPLPGERAATLLPVRGRAELLGGTLRIQELGPRLTRLTVDIPLFQDTIKQAA